MAVDSTNPATANAPASAADRSLLASSFRRYAPGAFYNLKASNTFKLRTAMQRTDKNCEIPCIGPSTTAGQSTGAGTSQAVLSWVAQLAKLLRARGIPAGANNFFGDKFGWGVGSSLANFLAGDGRLASSGAIITGGIKVAGGQPFAFNNATATFDFTPQDQVTKAEIVWRDSSTTTRTFSYGVDGGSKTNIQNTGAGQAVKRTTANLGSLGAHVLNMAWVAADPTLLGVTAYDDTNGRREISLLNWGVSGATTANLLDNTDASAGRLAMIDAFAAPGAILDDLPINDWGTSVSVATSKANIITLANRVISAGGNPILTTPLYELGSRGLAAQQQDYADMIFDVADQLDLPVIDVRGSWVSGAQALAANLISDSIVHPSTLGYALKAGLMTEFFCTLRAM